LIESRRALVGIFLITAVGTVPRIASFHFNDVPHGDIYLNYAVAKSFHESGTLKIPIASVRPYPVDRFGFGHPLDQHGPLWPILGGLGVFLFGNPFVAFKVITLISGIALLPLTFVASRRVIGKEAALSAALLAALTYVLSDYSGNGSLYIVQACLYLIFLTLLQRPETTWRTLSLGAVMGTGFLLNHQAIVLVPTLLAAYSLQARPTRSPTHVKCAPWVSCLVALFLVAPWLVRNLLVFDSLHPSGYSHHLALKLGITRVVFWRGELVSQPDWSLTSPPDALLAIGTWVGRNSAYMLFRLLTLAPLISLLAPLTMWRVSRRHPGTRGLGPAGFAWLLAFHMVLSCLWPVFKFRYFVPMLPLICVLGVWGLTEVVPPRNFRAAFLATITAYTLVGLLTYSKVPQHTAYYDPNEIVVLRTGESDWQRRQRALIEAVNALENQPEGVVLSEVSAVYFTERPIVNRRGLSNVEFVRHVMKKHRVEFIVAPKATVSLYRDAAICKMLFENDLFATLRCEIDSTDPHPASGEVSAPEGEVSASATMAGLLPFCGVPSCSRERNSPV
jgi:hypothetical protein